MAEKEITGTTTTSANVAVEDAKRRCLSLSDRLTKCKLSLSPSPKSTLLRLIQSELNFLHRISATPHPSPLSFNIGHLEAVVHVLQQPYVSGVSRICRPVSLSASSSVYVDIVCSLNGSPVWFVVSDRNPRYIVWDGGSSKDRGLKEKVELVIDAARSAPIIVRPVSVMLFFSNGVDGSVCEKLRSEFGGVLLDLMEGFECEEVELEDGWVNVVLGRSFSEACVIEIKVGKGDSVMEENNALDSGSLNGYVSCKKFEECSVLNIGWSLCTLVSKMKCWCCPLDASVELDVGSAKRLIGISESKFVNFDTTSMVAIVSGISNGGTAKLLATPESELRGRFKGNYEFVIAQVNSENQNPIHLELSYVLVGKRGIICESVFSEFQDLISMVGGSNEKLRARYFLEFLKVVPDCPSTRVMGLPTTRKLALKNKVVFGTGDYWNAPTITANMAFVRAVAQTGMSLSVIEHRPRALVGH